MTLFANLAALRQAVLDECARADTPFVAAFPRFVAQTEQRIAEGGEEPLKSPPIRSRRMQTTISIDVVDGEAPLPADFLDFTRLSWSGVASELTYVPPDRWSFMSQAGAGTPSVFTVEGNTLLLARLATGSLQGTYHARPLRLAADTDSNWLLTGSPDVYLQGVLMHAYEWARDDERAARAFARFVSAATAVNRHSIAAMTSGRPLAPILGDAARRPRVAGGVTGPVFGDAQWTEIGW